MTLQLTTLQGDLIHVSQVAHQAYVPSPELDCYDMKGFEHDRDDANDQGATEVLLISPSTRMPADQPERRWRQQQQQQVSNQIKEDEKAKVFDLPTKRLASTSNPTEEKLADQHLFNDQNFETNLLALQAYSHKHGSPVSLPAPFFFNKSSIRLQLTNNVHILFHLTYVRSCLPSAKGVQAGAMAK
jgi:hypothetical protein